MSRTFFSNHAKEIVIGTVLAIITGLMSMAVWVTSTIVTHNAQIEYLEKEVERLNTQVESLEATASQVPGLMRKWNNCRQKELSTGIKHIFYWDVLECISYPESVPEKRVGSESGNNNG